MEFQSKYIQYLKAPQHLKIDLKVTLKNHEAMRIGVLKDFCHLELSLHQENLKGV